jgi:release factor glutamine methyltransferase
MRVKELQQQFHKELDAIYDKKEVDNFFFMLLDSFFNIQRITVALQPELTVSDKETDSFFKATNDLKKEKPIQYIIGETEFYGLPFKVSESVLIPRPETEELVAWVIDEVEDVEGINILDVGTGSGCIAISLAKNLPKAKVFALDVSKDALIVARRNAKLNDAEVEFFEADILNINVIAKEERLWQSESIEKKLPRFDIIVSNPPYVRKLEKAQLKNNVLKHEPHLALFVKDDDPLLFYKSIIRLSIQILTPNGQLYFEINEYLGEEMMRLLNQGSFVDVKLKQDIFKKNRMITATRI